jgi:F0F1-type ATP synthase membrane subunit b/b'
MEKNQMPTGIGSVFDNPEFTKWLFGQSVAFVAVVVALSLWIWTLLRLNTALQQRNEKLSDDFIRTIETDSHERAQLSEDSLLRLDSTVRNIAAALTSALSQRRKDLDADSE